MTLAIHKAIDFVKARREAGLTDETMLVLFTLREHGPMTKETVAQKTGINITTLPRYLTALVGSGHLEKRQSEEDRREVLFSLSSGHGERLVDSLLKHFPNGDGTAAP